MDKLLKILAAIVLFAAALCLAFQFGWYRRSLLPQPHVEPKADTLYVHDTCVQIKPIYVTKVVLDCVRIPVPVRDTVIGKDTVFVWLQREQVQWTDSLCTVYASGIQPQVDSVAHYVTQQIITVPVIEKKKTRWGLGLQAGAGASKDGLTPYVGFGISYNILAW